MIAKILLLASCVAADDEASSLLQVKPAETRSKLDESAEQEALLETESQSHDTLATAWFFSADDASLVAKDKKCAYGGSSRLFREEHVDTLAACKSLCESEFGCKFVSYQKKKTSMLNKLAGKFDGVCMGCSTAEDAQDHVGFGLYSMPEKQEGLAGPGKKCPHNHADRLFRKTGVRTLEACESACESEEGCKFFSYQKRGAAARGTDTGNFDGVCMGCTSAEHAQDHPGFDLFAMPENKDLRGPGMKCPHKHADRLFRKTEIMTLDACKHACETTAECRFYSYQKNGAHDRVNKAGDFDGVCMGCSSADNAEAHPGFNLFALPQDETALAMGKKCPHKHEDRLFRLEGIPDLDACKEACSEAEGCKFYSYSDGGNFKGVCMGCTSADNAQDHPEFNIYEMPAEAPATTTTTEPLQLPGGYGAY